MMDTNLKKIFKDTQDFQNIFEVEIPEQMNHRMKSGIDFIDQLFGEGFVPGTVTLFTGDPGAGKSTICLQIADGFSSQNIITSYCSAEEHLSQVKKTVDRLDLRYPFFVSNSNNIDNVLKQCKQNKVKVLIVDSLQTMASGKLEPGNFKTMKSLVQKVIQYTKENFIVSILIGHVNKNGSYGGPSSLKHMTDAHLHLDLCTSETCMTCDIGTRTICLEKFRFGVSNQPKQLFLFPQGFKAISVS